MKSKLDWCVKNTYSIYDDINFGLCITQSTNVQCSSTFLSQKFITTKLNRNFDFEKALLELSNEKNFKNLIRFELNSI